MKGEGTVHCGTPKAIGFFFGHRVVSVDLHLQPSQEFLNRLLSSFLSRYVFFPCQVKNSAAQHFCELDFTYYSTNDKLYRGGFRERHLINYWLHPINAKGIL